MAKHRSKKPDGTARDIRGETEELMATKQDLGEPYIGDRRQGRGKREIHLGKGTTGDEGPSAALHARSIPAGKRARAYAINEQYSSARKYERGR